MPAQQTKPHMHQKEDVEAKAHPKNEEAQPSDQGADLKMEKAMPTTWKLQRECSSLHKQKVAFNSLKESGSMKKLKKKFIHKNKQDLFRIPFLWKRNIWKEILVVLKMVVIMAWLKQLNPERLVILLFVQEKVPRKHFQNLIYKAFSRITRPKIMKHIQKGLKLVLTSINHRQWMRDLWLVQTQLREK